jgi:hypothetical protein
MKIIIIEAGLQYFICSTAAISSQAVNRKTATITDRELHQQRTQQPKVSFESNETKHQKPDLLGR